MPVHPRHCRFGSTPLTLALLTEREAAYDSGKRWASSARVRYWRVCLR